MRTLVVFDIDGTLVDSVAEHVSAFRTALHAVGMRDIPAVFSGYRHHTDSWIFREIFRDNQGRLPDAEEMATFAKALTDAFDVNRIGEIPGAAAFLRKLADIPEVTTVFATGGLRDVTTAKLDLLAVNRREFVVTATDHTFREHIVTDAVSRAGGPFDRVIAFGDGPWDVRAAISIGSEFVGVGPATTPFGGWFPPANLVNAFGQVELDRRYPVDPPAGAVPAAPDAGIPRTSGPEPCVCWS